MTTAYNCTLEGVSLASLDDAIVLLDIREEAPSVRTAALPLHAGGQHLLAQRRESVSVLVRFALHEEDPARRQSVLQAIHAWAMPGGVLTISPRPGQQLTVACTALPALSFRDWPEEMTLVFTSTDVPWWEDAEYINLSGTGAHSVLVPGTADHAGLDVLILNASSRSVTALTVHCGDHHMTFEDFTFPSGSQLVLSHVNGSFSAKLDGSSVLKYRTMDSCDVFLPPCGETIELSVEAEVSLYTFFHLRGRYA